MRGTFDQYKAKVEGHLLMVGAGYLMDDEFLRLYKISTMAYAMSDGFWERFGIGQKQVLYDKTYLYGIIVSTNTNSYC